MRFFQIAGVWFVVIGFCIGVGGCTSDEKNIKVTMQFNGGDRSYEIDRQYFHNKINAPLLTSSLVLNVKYPEKTPCDRDFRSKQKCVLIVLDAETKMTHGEFIIEQWQHGRDKKNKGPGFDRYVGDEGPYQIFESQLGKDPNAIVRTKIFVDDLGKFVADDGRRASAWVSGMGVVYNGAEYYQATPKEMHLWIVKFVEELERGELKAH